MILSSALTRSRPTPKVEDHSLLAVWDSLFHVLATTGKFCPSYSIQIGLWDPPTLPSNGSQSRSRRGDKEKNSQPLPGIEPTIIQAVAQRGSERITVSLLKCLMTLVSHPPPSAYVAEGILQCRPVQY